MEVTAPGIRSVIPRELHAVTDADCTCCSERFVTCTNVSPLLRTSTNVILYIDYTPIKKLGMKERVSRASATTRHNAGAQRTLPPPSLPSLLVFHLHFFCLPFTKTYNTMWVSRVPFLPFLVLTPETQSGALLAVITLLSHTCVLGFHTCKVGAAIPLLLWRRNAARHEKSLEQHLARSGRWAPVCRHSSLWPTVLEGVT